MPDVSRKAWIICKYQSDSIVEDLLFGDILRQIKNWTEIFISQIYDRAKNTNLFIRLVFL